MISFRPAIYCLVGLVVALGLGLSNPDSAHAEGELPPLPGICSESDRFGVGVAGWIGWYDVGQLSSGWYTNFTVAKNPPHPAGMGFVQVVRISDDGPFQDRACSSCPTWETMRENVQRNPGSLWFIGNEPDRQDYIKASRYAELYHEFYTFLKTEDPTCQVGVGGVVQPTPIRLQYLDLILNAYQASHGKAMPVDVWNTHNYVLREGVTGWGCGVPPGTDSALAIEYGIQDHDNMTFWISHLTSMRQWMRDRGYRDRPLIITEYGTLMPEIYNYDYERVRDFMIATFDWMTTATDPNTGYPADGNRLVQAWSWYSLDDPAFEGWHSWNNLFDPDTRVITPLGLDFGGYASSLKQPLPGSIDLEPRVLRHSHPIAGPAGLLTTTMTAEIYNGGGSAAHNVVVRFARDGGLAGETIIPFIAAGGSENTSIEWTNLKPGRHRAGVEVNPDRQIVECDYVNNELLRVMVIGEHRIYVPLVQRN